MGAHGHMCECVCVHVYRCECMCGENLLSHDKGKLTDASYWHKVANSACLLQVPDDGSSTVLWQLHRLAEIAQIELVR